MRRLTRTFLLLTALATPQAAMAMELIDIPGGSFVMGDAKGDANEAPKQVTVQPFRLMRTEVTLFTKIYDAYLILCSSNATHWNSFTCDSSQQVHYSGLKGKIKAKLKEFGLGSANVLDRDPVFPRVEAIVAVATFYLQSSIPVFEVKLDRARGMESDVLYDFAVEFQRAGDSVWERTNMTSGNGEAVSRSYLAG